MQQGAVVDLDARLALPAARISLERKLPMTDSIILATARAYGATVRTQDEDFKGLPGASSIGSTSLEMETDVGRRCDFVSGRQTNG